MALLGVLVEGEMEMKQFVKKPELDRRWLIESYGEVGIIASVWEDLDAQIVERNVEKMSPGQSEMMNFRGSHNVGRTRVRRVK